MWITSRITSIITSIITSKMAMPYANKIAIQVEFSEPIFWLILEALDPVPPKNCPKKQKWKIGTIP